MPKKTKKQIRKMPAMVESTPSVASSMTTSAFAPSMTAGRTSDSEFKPDYTETKKDLKRIGYPGQQLHRDPGHPVLFLALNQGNC